MKFPRETAVSMAVNKPGNPARHSSSARLECLKYRFGSFENGSDWKLKRGFWVTVR